MHNTLRARAWDDADGMLAHMYRDKWMSPIFNLRRRLKIVLDVIRCIRASGFSLARGLELSSQWNKVVAAGLVAQ